jgi:hypothetical protein
MGETSTATTIRVNGGSLWTGFGVTNTTSYCGNTGDCIFFHTGTTLNIAGGSVLTRDAGTWTNVTVYGGYLYPQSTGTISNLYIEGGEVNALECGVARTITAARLNRGVFKYDSAFVTVSTHTTASVPVTLTATEPVS